MLHTSLGKSKKKKPTAKQRELQDSWQKLLKKYEPKKPVKTVVKQELRDAYSLGRPAGRETPKIPSLPFTGAPCTKKANPVYTGDKIKGIGTMHKSNAVPIFTDEQAVEIATMRRG
jgi:hypothetical protein